MTEIIIFLFYNTHASHTKLQPSQSGLDQHHMDPEKQDYQSVRWVLAPVQSGCGSSFYEASKISVYFPQGLLFSVFVTVFVSINYRWSR